MTKSIRYSSDMESQVRELDMLREQFPGFDIWLEERSGGSMTFAARRRRSCLHPHTLVTADPDEMRMQLRQNFNNTGSPLLSRRSSAGSTTHSLRTASVAWQNLPAESGA